MAIIVGHIFSIEKMYINVSLNCCLCLCLQIFVHKIVTLTIFALEKKFLKETCIIW